MPVEDRKIRILAAAEELISKQGIDNTTVADISQKAGTAESLVYQIWKSKENLLFSVAKIRLEEAIEFLDEQIQGIKDAESKLRKIVWYSLRYNDRFPGYIRILLFECRSNRNFYTSQAYTLLKKHAGITLDVLNQGVADGTFRDDVDMRLVRDIIYGTLDLESIGNLATGETSAGIEDFDAIMALLVPMILKNGQHVDENKEKRILAAAEDEFSERGFGNANIADIAKKARVAEGTIYEYFENKEDLLLSIGEKGFQEQFDSLQEVFRIDTNSRKLRRMIRYHFGLYLKNRRFLKIFLLHMLLNIRFYRSKSYDMYRNYFRSIERVIEDGKEDGSFRPDVDSRVFRNMFIGAFSHMAIRWVIVQNDVHRDKMLEIDRIVNLLTDAVLA